ncbi:MAG: 3-carboxy-cis,cis-muconate cycloisomerase [Desulfobacterales bacterium]|nr:MAG: 3-carboxy-cis,cis-muconate cycloisomerase [Desulfobacterales bacterium]
MTLALDSKIFGPLFTDPEVAEIFDDDAFLRAMLEVEGALARVEAGLGIIPASAGERISKITGSASLDPQQIGRSMQRDGVPVIALVKGLREAVGKEASPYVHWGATTQDIVDTATVLQIRSVLRIIENRLSALIDCLADLADRHRATVMAGRTHGQQALPVSFGLKAAGWLAPLVRHSKRLAAQRSSLLQLQFGGAAGTLAALGENGLAVMQGLAQELELNLPMMPWHTQRDSFAEFAGWLSMLTASQAKMAQDIILLAQNEVGEVAESGKPDRGGSTSMPQKRNPIVSELVIAAARTNASLLSAMHHAMIQEHERATHGWQVEWLSLSQMIVLTGGALKNTFFLAKNLKVNETVMRENLARSNDLVLAEAVVQALSSEIPRTEAQALVKQACRVAAAEGRSLIEIVRKQFGEMAPSNKIDWEALAKPENYLGQTGRFIDRVLEHVRRIKSTE